jgi:hypothetical protein
MMIMEVNKPKISMNNNILMMAGGRLHHQEVDWGMKSGLELRGKARKADYLEI